MGRTAPKKRRRRGPSRPKQRPLPSGVLKATDGGSATVDTAEGRFHISRGNVGEAMNGDLVQVRPLQGFHGSLPRASVAHVVERQVVTFAATYVEDGPLRVLVPFDDRLLHDFLVDPSDPAPARLGLRDGDPVCARVSAYPTRRAPGVAAVERAIGEGGRETLAVDAIIANHDLAVGFSPEVVAEVRALKLDVDAALADPRRRDIRDRFVATVDPADARDFDDALSLEALPRGGWLLGVHIADVSAYVPQGSAVDLAARERATSVYLVDRVLPMLPEELSCDLCSLRPREDRLAVTVDLVLDAEGRMTSSTAYPSVIRSRARLSYDEVDALLQGAGASAVEGVDLAAFFKELDAVRVRREALRRERGAIEFVSSEARAVLDERLCPVGVSVRRGTPATGIVEEAMLMANEAVARIVGAARVPGVYRVHERPAHDALAAAAMRLQELGCLGGVSRAALVSGDPRAVQAVLDGVRGRPEEELVSSLLLRAMKRATYEPEDVGHYGLGAAAYCHFTSPIRRYPDLVMHRSLKAALARNLKASKRRELEELLPAVCRHASKMERVAAAASSESQAAKIAEYLGGFVGDVFDGAVVSVHPFGLFVRLNDTLAEGLLPTQALGPGWWNFDEDRAELVSEDEETRYRLGQPLAVRVTATDALRGRIDFALP